jgi:hypothetical protein
MLEVQWMIPGGGDPRWSATYDPGIKPARLRPQIGTQQQRTRIAVSYTNLLCNRAADVLVLLHVTTHHECRNGRRDGNRSLLMVSMLAWLVALKTLIFLPLQILIGSDADVLVDRTAFVHSPHCGGQRDCEPQELGSFKREADRAGEWLASSVLQRHDGAAIFVHKVHLP